MKSRTETLPMTEQENVGTSETATDIPSPAVRLTGSRHRGLAMMAAIAALGPAASSGPMVLRNIDHPMVSALPADPHYKPRRRGGSPVARMFPRSQAEAKTHVTAKRKRKLAKASKRRNRR